MAVFFRLIYESKWTHVEIKLLSCAIMRFDIKMANNTILVKTKRRRKTISLIGKSIENTNRKSFELPNPKNNLLTFLSTEFECLLSSKNDILNFDLKNLLVLIFGLIENTRGVVFGENGKKTAKSHPSSKLFFSLKFALKIHLVRIICYLFEMLKLKRRKYYGS